jgi:hypothetical protein
MKKQHASNPIRGVHHWEPEALLKRLHATDGMVVESARVECGGEYGSVITFVTDVNDRFTYTMPHVVDGWHAVERLRAEHPERFPITLQSATAGLVAFARV